MVSSSSLTLPPDAHFRLDVINSLAGRCGPNRRRETNTQAPKSLERLCECSRLFPSSLVLLSRLPPSCSVEPLSTRPATPCLTTPSKAARRPMLFFSVRYLREHTNCSRRGMLITGAIGGPKWGVGPVRPEQGLLRIRKELGLYANIRPASFASPSLLKHSPLKEERAKGVDIIVVRELIGGACTCCCPFPPRFSLPARCSNLTRRLWRQTRDR